VVDDEQDIGLLLKLVLEKNGYIVNYYDNPINALNEYKSNFYDLVIIFFSNFIKIFRNINNLA
jgi:DNA-binding response OmpR family regulator